MSALVYVIPFLITRPATAAPVGLHSTLAGTLVEGLRPLGQGVIDFLNPNHSPSLKQTIISCIFVLFASVFLVARPIKSNRVGLDRLRIRLAVALYGLLSVDLSAFAVFRRMFGDFFLAVAYNVLIRPEGQNKHPLMTTKTDE